MNYLNKWVSVGLTLSCLFIQNANAGKYGRLEDPSDPKNRDAARLRCGGNPLPQDKCDLAHTEGVKTGCITAEESSQLKQWGMAPVCFFGSYSGWCSCGCFEPATLISIYGFAKTAKAGDIANQYQNYTIQHLGEHSKIGSFALDGSGILFSTVGAEAKPLVVIETEDGRTLKVTTQHAIMTAQGEMIKAEQVTLSTVLLDQTGELVPIKALRTEIFTGDVVNFRLDVKKPIEHVVFAEGLAVGDQAWQSTLEDLQKQILIRQ